MNNNREFFQDIKNLNVLKDDDPEGRHLYEDELARELLREIAEAGGTYSLRAKLLVEVLDEPAVRWYA